MNPTESMTLGGFIAVACVIVAAGFAAVGVEVAARREARRVRRAALHPEQDGPEGCDSDSIESRVSNIRSGGES